MQEIRIFFGGIFCRDSEAIRAKERYQVALREARQLIKKLEDELKKRGNTGVEKYESETIAFPPVVLGGMRSFLPGRHLVLKWDLRDCSLSNENRYGWESKRVEVGILKDGGKVVGSSGISDTGHGTTYWLEDSREYHKFLEVRQRAADGGRMESAKPTLEERVRFAMQQAEYVPDGRFDRSLD